METNPKKTSLYSKVDSVWLITAFNVLSFFALGAALLASLGAGLSGGGAYGETLYVQLWPALPVVVLVLIYFSNKKKSAGLAAWGLLIPVIWAFLPFTGIPIF